MESLSSSASVPPSLWVAAGEDRFGEHRGLGVSTITFKVVPRDIGKHESANLIELTELALART
jgi:hypothetical protein